MALLNLLTAKYILIILVLVTLTWLKLPYSQVRGQTDMRSLLLLLYNDTKKLSFKLEL